MTLQLGTGAFKTFRQTAAALAVALLLAGSADAQQPQNIVKPEDIQKLKDDAIKSAQTWAATGDETPNMQKRTFGWSYDDKDVEALKKIVTTDLPAAKLTTAQNYYVLNYLIGPLGNSPKASIRAALPFIKPIKTLESYETSFKPPMTDVEARKQYGTPNLANVDPEKRLRILEQLDEKRQQKLTRDSTVARQNSQVAGFERTKYGLMYLSDDEKEDADLIRAIFDVEKSKSHSWSYITEMLNNQVKNKTISKEHAARLYKRLAPLADSVRWAYPRGYTEFGKVTVENAANSHFTGVGNIYFGGQIMGVINGLAGECGEKAVAIPTPGKPETGWNPPHRK